MAYGFPNERPDFWGKDSDYSDRSASNYWLISADKIFSSAVNEFKDFSRFFDIEFAIRRSSITSNGKSSDSYVCAEEVKIFMPVGRYCAMLLSRLGNKALISKIIIKKMTYMSNKLTPIEEKEFQNCSIQSFSRKGDVIAFTFRYNSFSDAYTEFKPDGSKLGTSAANIDLVTWKVEEK